MRICQMYDLHASTALQRIPFLVLPQDTLQPTFVIMMNFMVFMITTWNKTLMKGCFKELKRWMHTL
uniref:Uncharacterized protein n=1 Tax=Arundo donax TaxID=35708 RepID=A0A0A8Z1X7_ARUDO